MVANIKGGSYWMRSHAPAPGSAREGFLYVDISRARHHSVAIVPSKLAPALGRIAL